MIIAVDFDGTIVEHKYPKIGKPIPYAIDTLKQLQNEQHILILWTVREGDLLQEAIDYCSENGLIFYSHNSNFPEEDSSKASRKLTADMFIDDRNFGGLPGWDVIYRAIQQKTAHQLGFTMSFQEGDGENSIKGSLLKKLFKKFN